MAKKTDSVTKKEAIKEIEKNIKYYTAMKSVYKISKEYTPMKRLAHGLIVLGLEIELEALKEEKRGEQSS